MRQIVALHGQLGMASDWDSFSHCAKINGFDVEKIDLWPYLQHHDLSMLEFGEHLNKTQSQIDSLVTGDILLGYSMGGRLALHALIDDPSRWSAVVIVSAHFGMTSKDEQAARRKVDDAWAHESMTLPWDEFLVKWNQQTVLNSANNVLQGRSELENNRQEISRSFKCWSLAEQQYLLPKLMSIKVPVLFVTGEKDRKFNNHITNMLESLDLPNMEAISLPDVGHRVPWEDEASFCDRVFDWLKKIG